MNDYKLDLLESLAAMHVPIHFPSHIKILGGISQVWGEYSFQEVPG